MKSVKFPTTGTVFDYYIDPETKKFEPWTKRVVPFEFDPSIPLQVLHHLLLRNCHVTTFNKVNLVDTLLSALKAFRQYIVYVLSVKGARCMRSVIQ